MRRDRTSAGVLVPEINEDVQRRLQYDDIKSPGIYQTSQLNILCTTLVKQCYSKITICHCVRDWVPEVKRDNRPTDKKQWQR